uniref:Uncharacterized protein n=1 Tax=Rhizophora mucronata TaxID=61149 RepID=A0A2P2PQA3_RHIMU
MMHNSVTILRGTPFKQGILGRWKKM